MIRIRSATTFFTIATGLLLGLGSGVARAADTTVQIPLTALLDARSVTTVTAGKLVVWTLPTDGGGLQNAFATHAVATMQNLPAEATNTLPDDGHFPANDRHPDVVLNFSNDADAASPQTHLVLPSAMFSFPVPPATYSKLFLFFNGAANGTTIKVTFTYSDGMDVQNATIPDYYADVDPTDPVIFDLATNLAKWSKTTQVAEANHHNITGAELHPAAGKTLSSVTVERGGERLPRVLGRDGRRHESSRGRRRRSGWRRSRRCFGERRSAGNWRRLRSGWGFGRARGLGRPAVRAARSARLAPEPAPERAERSARGRLVRRASLAL